MGKALTIIARLIALVFATVLVVSIPLSVIAYDAGRVMFNPPLVKQVSMQIFAESDLVPSAMEWFTTRQAEERYQETGTEPGEGEPNIMTLITLLDSEDWLKIQQEILPDDLVREWIRTVVDGIYAWVDNDQPAPDMVLDLMPLVQRMEQNGEKVIMIAYNNLDPCTEEQIRDLVRKIQTSPPGTQIAYQLCRLPLDFPTPEESYGQDQIDSFLSSLETLVVYIPREIDVGKMLSGNNTESARNALELKQQLRGLRLVMNLSPLVPLVLMMLILLFGIRSLKTLGKWWGIPILLGSLAALGASLLHRPFLNRVLANGLLSDLPLMLRPQVGRILAALSGQVFRRVFWHSLGLVVLGVGLILLMVFAKTPAQKKQ